MATSSFMSHNYSSSQSEVPRDHHNGAQRGAIDIILQPVIGRFVSVYMDDVIITSSSFKDHLDHLTQVFTLLRDAGLTLNKEKCHFARDKLKYLGLIISKEGIETDNKKIKAITEMKPPKNNREVSKFLGMTGELRVYIPGSLRKDIMKEFHDLPLAGHLGKRKTYLKLRDTCYFPFMRKYIFEYVSTCDRCQKFNYKNALPAGRLMPIVSKYPNEIVTLDLVGPHPASRPERYKFILVITDHFTKWCELIPLRKASAQTIANAFFNTYIARYGAPISLISDNGPQFISDVFEHLSHRLDIKHMKTVTYRPQSNLTERVNRNLVQMIASFVEENHENWDQFLHEFAFALRAAVGETTGRAPAELFLGGKIITPFSKLINVTEDAKYVEVSHGSNRSHQGQFKEHRKTSSQESEGCRSRQSNTTREIPRNKRKINSTASKEQALKRSKICKKRSRQGSDHQDRKRHAPEQRQGVKRSIPSSISSRTYKFKRPNTSSPGVQSISGPSKLPDRRTTTTTGGSRMEVSGRDNQTRQTRATTRRRNEQTEKPVRSNQTNTRRPCPYYLRSRIQEKDRIHEDLNNIEINGIPGSTFRRRSLSMEALNGDPVHRI
ncbi:retrovirus-related Pol polyprotein from transposon 412 [Trichonephila clavipes]|nr:retrovirus-related Pol polyprotein from transposon 412 [Trichonephila clavipes]